MTQWRCQFGLQRSESCHHQPECSSSLPFHISKHFLANEFFTPWSTTLELTPSGYPKFASSLPIPRSMLETHLFKIALQPYMLSLSTTLDSDYSCILYGCPIQWHPVFYAGQSIHWLTNICVWDWITSISKQFEWFDNVIKPGQLVYCWKLVVNIASPSWTYSFFWNPRHVLFLYAETICHDTHRTSVTSVDNSAGNMHALPCMQSITLVLS